MIPTASAPRRLLIEKPGFVRAASEQVEAQAGGRVEDALGVSWDTLEALARTTQVVEGAQGRMRLELLVDRAGDVAAVLASSEVHVAAASTPPPPSSSRWGKDLATLAGKDVGTRAAIDLALRFAKTTLPVLISAEEGGGADVLARAMHAAGGGARGPFVHVRVGTIPPGALESVLFTASPAAARDGMLFLEDVHDLDPAMGRRLAKELDRGALYHVRFVGSAHPELADRVHRGDAARELLTLVRGSTVTVPALRDRDDFEHLASLLLKELGGRGTELTPATLEVLKAYSWPGNLAELGACLEYASVMAGHHKPIGVEHLPQGVFAKSVDGPSGEGLRRSAERAVLEEALRASSGNLSAAAKRMGVARSTLYRLMKRYGIPR